MKNEKHDNCTCAACHTEGTTCTTGKCTCGKTCACTKTAQATHK